MKKSGTCTHKNKGTMTIGGVTFTKVIICNDCGKIMDRSDR